MSICFRRRHPSTPRRDADPPTPDPGQDIFSHEDLLPDCRALPPHLFSPARQAQLVSEVAPRPRYQEIPHLDYGPRTPGPDTPGLDTFLMSPGCLKFPATEAPPHSPMGPPASVPGSSASCQLSSVSPVSQTPQATSPQQLHSVPVVLSSAPSKQDPDTNTVSSNHAGPSADFSVQGKQHIVRVINMQQNSSSSPKTVKRRHSLDEQLDDLAKVAEKDPSDESRSEIFKRMNELVSEETTHDLPDIPDYEPPGATDNVVRGIQPLPQVSKKVFMKPRKTPPTPANVKKGSWRFTPENPQPQCRSVKVKSITSTRKMHMGEDCDKITINIQPLVQTSPPKKDKKKTIKNEDKSVAKISLTIPAEPKVRKINYSCDDCSYKCRSIEEIKNHPCRTKVQCEDCGIILANKKVLREHLKLLHPFIGGEKHKCNHCSKSFHSKTLRKEHVKQKHPVEYIRAGDATKDATSSSCNTSLDVCPPTPTQDCPSDLEELNLLENVASSIDEEQMDDEEMDDLSAYESLANTIDEEEEDNEIMNEIAELSQDSPQGDDGQQNDLDLVNVSNLTDVDAGSESMAPPPVSENKSVDVSANNNFCDFPMSVESDIDNPPSVQSNWSQSITEPRSVQRFFVKPTSVSKCGNCGKVFNTSVRFNNHQKHCRSGGGEASQPQPPPAPRPLYRVRRKTNPRLERLHQLRTNWSESLSGRARCDKCGRDNYLQDDLASHQVRCQGTLQLLAGAGARGPRFECPYCAQPRMSFPTENAMRRHVATTHAKEALDDGWDYKAAKVRTVGLATKHLFK